MAVILTRYGCDEDTVVAGILHDVVEDSVREGISRDELEERIGTKFGSGALSTVLAVAERRQDVDGVELSADERKADYLERLGEASDAARWVCAADTVHNGSALLADLKRTAFPETVWGRFARTPGATAQWYRRVYARLDEVKFRAAIMNELRSVVEALEGAAVGT